MNWSCCCGQKQLRWKWTKAPPSGHPQVSLDPTARRLRKGLLLHDSCCTVRMPVREMIEVASEKVCQNKHNLHMGKPGRLIRQCMVRSGIARRTHICFIHSAVSDWWSWTIDCLTGVCCLWLKSQESAWQALDSEVRATAHEGHIIHLNSHTIWHPWAVALSCWNRVCGDPLLHRNASWFRGRHAPDAQTLVDLSSATTIPLLS